MGPEGCLVEHVCADCRGRHTVLYRPESPDGATRVLPITLAANEEDAEAWIAKHERCEVALRGDLITEDVRLALGIIRNHADGLLKRGRPVSPLMVAIPEAGSPLKLDVSSVIFGPVEERPTRQFEFVAAVREYARQAAERFDTVVYYYEAYHSLMVDLPQLDGMLPGFREAAQDPHGRFEMAFMNIETSDKVFCACAPIIRKSGRAEHGSGRLGPIRVSAWSAAPIRDSVIAEEKMVRAA